MRQYPGDVFVERAYIGAMENYDSDTVKVVAEFKARHEQHPENTEITYLYATTLVGRDTPQAIKLSDAVLEKAPNFNLPHLDFVRIYGSPNFLDKHEAIAHEKAFLAACPAALEGYSSLGQLDDKELTAQSIPRLRQILQPRSDSDALRNYSTLWSLEFSAKPASEYGALRKQVAADVARIRAFNRQDLREWWSALEDGYKLATDSNNSEWAKNERETRFPNPWELHSRDQWLKDHPRPNDDAPFDQKQAYDRDLLKQSEDWIKQRPDSMYVWFSRLRPMEDLNEIPASDVAACVANILELAQADAGPNPIDSYVRFTLAEAIYKRKLDPQQQVEMARRGVEQLNAEMKRPPYDGFTTKELHDQNFYQTYTKAQGLFYEADGYVRLKEADNARAAKTTSNASHLTGMLWLTSPSSKAANSTLWPIISLLCSTASIPAHFPRPAQKTTSATRPTIFGACSGVPSKAGNHGTAIAQPPSPTNLISLGRRRRIRCRADDQ
jgi:hypothetical protein